MNKYHNGKASGGKGPTPGNTGVKPRPGKESTAAWKTNIGPVGPKRNSVNFKEVKVSVKQRMSDDGVPLMMQGTMFRPDGVKTVMGGSSDRVMAPGEMLRPDMPGSIIGTSGPIPEPVGGIGPIDYAPPSRYSKRAPTERGGWRRGRR